MRIRSLLSTICTSYLTYFHFILLPNKGGNQLTLASVCESKNMMTSPLATLAPASLAPMSPFLEGRCITFVLT